MSDIVERPPDCNRDKIVCPCALWADQAAAEIERLQEQVAALQASSGYELSIAQLEIERLTADNHRLMLWNEQLQADLDIARRALEGK